MGKVRVWEVSGGGVRERWRSGLLEVRREGGQGGEVMGEGGQE